MTERARAKRRRSEKRHRTVVMAMRLLPAERDVLVEAAHKRGVSLSEFIRTAALGATP